jgi:hypothetical protein
MSGRRDGVGRESCSEGVLPPSRVPGHAAGSTGVNATAPAARAAASCPGDQLEPAGTIRKTGRVPLIDVTYDGRLGEEVLRRLGGILPGVVGEAVECPEDPVAGPEQPGDIEIRFRKRSPLDVGGLDVVIEVRTKLSGHRVLDKQRRADVIRERLSGLPLGQVGVWLILCEGAWSQS